MDRDEVRQLVERLGSDEDGVRKMAAFKLQTSIADPSFADVFMNSGGITKLRWLVLHATGNTLAYSLAAFSRLLEVDMGWSHIDQTLIERVVELVVTHPLVNILRGAMSILAAVVSHPHTSPGINGPDSISFGFRALKPAISMFPQFLEMLVNRLTSADHALCINALQLINALMRDAGASGLGQEWPELVKRLQDLGVIRAVNSLMQGSALQDLAQPLLEFQNLTKILMRKWRNIPVDLEKPEHRRMARDIYQTSYVDVDNQTRTNSRGVVEHALRDWTRLGFKTDIVADDFEDVGYLGMMDLVDYVRKNEDTFQRILLEQASQEECRRCPLARCSIAVTGILYEHFAIDKADIDDPPGYIALDSANNFDRIFKPSFLQWSKLHTSGVQAFLRLWKATGAENDDFGKVAELVRILLETTLGGAGRTRNIEDIEEEIQNFSYQRLRELQMELAELTYEDSWGHYLRQVRDELNHEALQFIKEQRIRCLLSGSWFQMLKFTSVTDEGTQEIEYGWGFVKLSHNRRFLHFRGYESLQKSEPSLDELTNKVDLSTVSSVISNVTATAHSAASSSSSLLHESSSQPQSRIAINGMLKSGSNSQTHHRSYSASSQGNEVPLLTLYPQSRILAAEWLDGLLLLLKQAPITSETKNLLGSISGWGLKIRLLNVNFDNNGIEQKGTIVPSREGLDENYHYADFAGP